jgi:agmatinase
MIGSRRGNEWDDDSEKQELETAPDASASTRTFYGAPTCANLDELDAQVAFLGVPYDQGSPVPGSRSGPNAIRDIRVYQYNTSQHTPGVTQKSTEKGPRGYYDIEGDRFALTGVTMADCGNVNILAGDVERNYGRITRTVRKIVARGALLVAVGGDHSITAPIVRGFEHTKPIDIVHFDAHHDYFDHNQGNRNMCAMPIRRCSEMPWVRNITQIGIRIGGATREPFDASRARGNRIITADMLEDLGPEEAMELVPRSDNMYVTFDIDVMDGSLCPGTGTPEPGGPNYRQMRAALRALAKRGRVVGLDVVEVAPQFEHGVITARTASRLIIDFLTAVFDQRT